MIEEYIWKECNYKLMLGKWKIGIMLEAGYQVLPSAEPKDGCTKLTDRICFQNMLSPYPSSQPLTASAIQWSSETFQFPMPDIRVYFDDSKGRNGMYQFDFY